MFLADTNAELSLDPALDATPGYKNELASASKSARLV